MVYIVFYDALLYTYFIDIFSKKIEKVLDKQQCVVISFTVKFFIKHQMGSLN